MGRRGSRSGSSPDVPVWCLALLLAAGGTHARDTHGDASLRWNVEDLSSTAHQRLCRAVSVSWLEANGRVVWTAPLPERLRAVDSGLCRCSPRGGGRSCVTEPASGRSQPAEHDAPFGVRVLSDGDALVVADPSGVLVLDVRSGSPLLEWQQTSQEGGSRLYVDEGRFTLEGEGGCSGVLKRGRALAHCGARLLYVNGRSVALFRLHPARLETLVPIEAGHLVEAGNFVASPPGRVRARIPLGEHTLVVQGIVYLR